MRWLNHARRRLADLIQPTEHFHVPFNRELVQSRLKEDPNIETVHFPRYENPPNKEDPK